MHYDTDVLELKNLLRYDVFDDDKTPEEWVQLCMQNPEMAHGLSPVFSNYEYTWKPVSVLGYDVKTKKYQVKIVSCGTKKNVTRMSLQFYAEDEQVFQERLEMCKQKQAEVLTELKYTSLVDSVSHDSVSTLPEKSRIRSDFKKYADSA